ncbi:kielin/chordin-like protein [Oscarella lobularis]|uniref:kielin/chordin-like protein n=1 Tax=Oscarella lobularis TaxID=121494 RepID=UPI003313E945
MTKPSVLFTLAWVVAGLLQPRAEAISQQKTTEETTPVDLSGSAMKCSFDGQDYYPEEEFKPSPCSLCICHWSGKVNCTPIICDSVPCGQYAITLHPPKDECCPRCKNVMCYHKGDWHRAGQRWIEQVIERGKRCRSKCTCKVTGEVDCDKSENRCDQSVHIPTCKENGNVYHVGQKWIGRKRVNGRQCKMPCECTRTGKRCNKKACPKKLCRVGNATYREGEEFGQQSTECWTRCTCIDGGAKCVPCPTPSRPVAALSRCRRECDHVDFEREGCDKVRRKICTCPERCLRNGSTRCCKTVERQENVTLSCTGGRQKVLPIKQATHCICKACDPLSLPPPLVSSAESELF